MSRGAIALTLGLGPVVASVVLVAWHLRDWRLCMGQPGTGLADALLTASLLPSLVAALPFLLFGWLWHRRGNALTLWLWGIAAAILLLPLLTGDFHHCDRKGSSADFWPAVAALPAFALWLVALARSAARSAQAQEIR